MTPLWGIFGLSPKEILILAGMACGGMTAAAVVVVVLVVRKKRDGDEE
jgi:hypothetical protein